jgi:signal transduction histidine kinase
MPSSLAFLGEPYTVKSLDPLSLRINSSNVSANFVAKGSATDPGVVHEARQSADSSSRAGAEINAASNGRAEPVATVEHQLRSAMQRRKALIAASFLLVAIVGYVDYLTGYERSLLLFYLLPISLAAWFGNFGLALVIVLVSITVWKLSDLAAGIPAVGLWNAGMAFLSYALFAFVLSKLRTLVLELDRRVQERTAALEHEVAERQRLDREIAQVADRERRRLGQDLHDSLGQHLTGTALAAHVLKEKLAAKSAPEVTEAEKVVTYVEEGIDLTRNLARGFFSPELDADGLSVALEGLAENISERFAVNCVFHEGGLIPMRDPAVATQLYRIAQEATTNAAKHAAADRVDIRISVNDSELTLAIEDDGVGFSGNSLDSKGLGLRLMRHGAALIGGTFDIRRNGQRGTITTCKVTIPDNNGLNRQ